MNIPGNVGYNTKNERDILSANYKVSDLDWFGN